MNQFLQMNYYDTMMKIDEYNNEILGNEQIHIVISKLNNHMKFVKHVRSRYIYYVYLETNDTEIMCAFNEILKLPYEGDRRHSVANYIAKLFQDPENKKKFTIVHIYQK